MKFGEKNSYCFFFQKMEKNGKKRQERHAKMVDVSEILLEARFFAKSLSKLIGYIGSASPERNLGSAM